MQNPYESERLLEEYLLLHYGAPDTVLPWAFGPREALDFPLRCVEELLPYTAPRKRALELGCAVGRACFELSTSCQEVVGIDFSQQFIEQARTLVKDGGATFTFADEGDLRAWTSVRLDPRYRRERVSFEVGDATNLRDRLGLFDVVLMANLLCRVPDPKAVLDRLPGLVRPGGLLAITSPYSWSQEHTPPERWLGGYHREGEPIRTLATLRELLEPHFELQEKKDMPFMIREHARKFQWSVAQATVWRRHKAR
jgi:putative 4-mercaptohistidine N1-methyltranferase